MIANADKFAEFYKQVVDEGFHIFGREYACQPGFYPNEFPSFPEYDTMDVNVGDRVTIRAFFAVGKGSKPVIESGEIDLEVECVEVETDTVFANIITELPSNFSLTKNTTIELHIDEILQVHST